jgi:peptide/nickel transport system substrate-binding protein
MNRRTLLKSARAVGALAVVGLARPAISQRAASRAVRLVPHADLANFDPVWTTAYIARNAAASDMRLCAPVRRAPFALLE